MEQKVVKFEIGKVFAVVLTVIVVAILASMALQGGYFKGTVTEGEEAVWAEFKLALTKGSSYHDSVEMLVKKLDLNVTSEEIQISGNRGELNLRLFERRPKKGKEDAWDFAAYRTRGDFDWLAKGGIDFSLSYKDFLIEELWRKKMQRTEKNAWDAVMEDFPLSVGDTEQYRQKLKDVYGYFNDELAGGTSDLAWWNRVWDQAGDQAWNQMMVLGYDESLKKDFMAHWRGKSKSEFEGRLWADLGKQKGDFERLIFESEYPLFSIEKMTLKNNIRSLWDDFSRKSFTSMDFEFWASKNMGMDIRSKSGNLK